MNDTQEAPRADGSDDGFDSRRLRTVADMRRSSDDRLLAGVCAGAARYLRVDPVVVRVVIAVLTFAGLAGLILYVAAWLLVPADDAERSIVAGWFRIDENEEQVRTVGLAVAAILAALSVVGDTGWGWWDVGWVLLPLAALYYLFVIRRRRTPADRAPRPPTGAAPYEAQMTGASTVTPTGAGSGWPAPAPSAPPVRPGGGAPLGPPAGPPTGAAWTPPPPAAPRPRRSHALTLLTLSVAVIAVAVTRIYSELEGGVPAPAYIAVALAVVAGGLLIGTFYGHGGPLVAIGLLLTIALAVSTLLPSGRFGQDVFTPDTAAEVQDTYRHGMGELRIDLSEVRDPDALDGRRIDVEAGVGRLLVVVPDDLDVTVDADLLMGEIRVFDRTVNGTVNSLDEDGGPDALTLDLDQRIGQIEVVRP